MANGRVASFAQNAAELRMSGNKERVIHVIGNREAAIIHIFPCQSIESSQIIFRVEFDCEPAVPFLRPCSNYLAARILWKSSNYGSTQDNIPHANRGIYNTSASFG